MRFGSGERKVGVPTRHIALSEHWNHRKWVAPLPVKSLDRISVFAADPGFVPADSDAIADDVIGVWTLSQYQSSTPATMALLADGTAAGATGQWMLNPNTGVVNFELTNCAALAGTSHVFFVGSGGDGEMTGFGHSDAALPVRAARTDSAELTCAVPPPAE